MSRDTGVAVRWLRELADLIEVRGLEDGSFSGGQLFDQKSRRCLLSATWVIEDNGERAEEHAGSDQD